MFGENNQSTFEISDSDKEKLLDVTAKEYGNICGIVIAKGGNVVYQQSFHGYDICTPIHVASVTKSVFSALIGIAIEKGYIKSVDRKVWTFSRITLLKQVKKQYRALQLKICLP